mmetsp:Transcript_2339/g.5626  ORF Transcript_2339/g.5626 Transcript_2339/m.5626 type:complete len:84 (-) Transcript_2339:167-418(-)
MRDHDTFCRTAEYFGSGCDILPIVDRRNWITSNSESSNGDRYNLYDNPSVESYGEEPSDSAKSTGKMGNDQGHSKTCKNNQHA